MPVTINWTEGTDEHLNTPTKGISMMIVTKGNNDSQLKRGLSHPRLHSFPLHPSPLQPLKLLAMGEHKTKQSRPV